MSLSLRPYQSTVIDNVRSRMKSGVRSILITAPTGAGKTVLTAWMLKEAASRGMASWFCVHRRELVKQSVRTFGDVGVSHGVIANNFAEDRHQDIQVASIQTLARRYHKFKKPKLIIWDECHHIAAGSWGKIHAAFPDAFHIGLTATPERLDGKGLGKHFQEIVHGPSVKWLIENKYLSPYKLYAPSSVNVSKMHIQMGDYKKSELNAAVDKPTITGDAIKHYQKIAPGKRALVFCVSIEHSKHLVSQFIAAGIPSAHVDGETPTEERDNAIKDFENGKTKVLSNVDLFGEGFDLPALEVAILLRPTQSLGLYLQQVGRSLRTSFGKESAIILDHAGNVARHGLPCEERDWSLEGRNLRRVGSDESAPPVRICKSCFAAAKSGPPVCPFCGCAYEIKPRLVETVDGSLEEVNLDAMRKIKRTEQGKAQSLEELIEIGKKRGYKRPNLWAKYVMNSRQKRKVFG